jgi:hypothetical protein
MMMKQAEKAQLLIDDSFLDDIMGRVKKEYVIRWAREADPVKRELWWAAYNMADDVVREIVSAACE